MAGWLAERPFDLQPVVGEQLREVVRAAWTMTDAPLLALCVQRVAEAVGAELDPTPPPRTATTPLEQAAAAYADWYTVDPNIVRGPIDDELRRLLPLPELVNLVAALNALEGHLRACALLGIPSDVFALAPPAGTPRRPAPLAPGPEPDAADAVARRNYRLLLTDERYRTVRAEYQRETMRLNDVDPLTTEAVRLRNAWFQDCKF